MAIVVASMIVAVAATLEAWERSVQSDDDEFIRIGLPCYTAGAERIVVVVQHAESTTV